MLCTYDKTRGFHRVTSSTPCSQDINKGGSCVAFVRGKSGMVVS